MSLIGVAIRATTWPKATVPDLRLGDLLDARDTGQPPVARLRHAGRRPGACVRRSPRFHGVGAEDVVVTVGGMHALFLTAFIATGSRRRKR